MNILTGLPSHNLLATVALASDTPVLIMDALGRIDFVTPEFETRAGLLGAIRLGERFSRFCAVEDLTRIEAFLSAPGALPHEKRQIVTHIEGVAKRVTCSIRALHDTENIHIGFACYLGDYAETQSSPPTEREERWRVALESTDQAIWETRQSDEAKFVTDTWYRLRGLEPFADKAIISDWLHMVHAEDLSNLQSFVDSIQTGETDTINCQYRYRHAEGHWIWILTRGRVLSRDAQGLPDHIVGTDTDVTTLVNEQAQKNLLSNRLELSLDVSGVGIWEYDLDLEIEYWDPRVCAIHGVSPDTGNRPGADWDNFIHPDDKDEIIAHADHCFANKLDFHSDYRIIRRDGAVRHVRSRAKYVHAEQGAGPRFIGVNIDITDDVEKTLELEAARAAMEHDSRHDALTGLANRRKLDEVHSDFVSAAKAAGTTPEFAILNIDLDHFKEVNDTLGHNVGDQVLKHAANLIVDVVVDAGLVSRMGGDEFVVFLPGPFDPTQINHIVSEILRRAMETQEIEGTRCYFGMSIGIAKSCDTHTDISNVFVAADLALYQAKQDGRGGARYYESAMSSIHTPQKFHVDDIRRGLAASQFICHYRPQFSVQTGRIASVEALVRWNHPTLGLLQPHKFIPAVQAAGLAGELTEQALKIALSDQAKWGAAGLWVPCVSVKVAASYMRDPNFIVMLDSLTIIPEQISLEILETRLRESHEALFFKSLEVCRDYGIGIEIDGFGSGQSSVISVLKVAPQRIKVDSALIDAMIEGTSERQIVEAIVGIAKLSGAQVTAKGVSSPSHSALATEIGFDILQGDCLAYPVTETELRTMLNDR